MHAMRVARSRRAACAPTTLGLDAARSCELRAISAARRAARRPPGSAPPARAGARARGRAVRPSERRSRTAGPTARATWRWPSSPSMSEPSSSQMMSARQRRELEERGRLLERGLAEHELVAVVEAHELARDDHDRDDEHRAGAEPVVADDDDGHVERDQRGEAVGGREQQAVRPLAPRDRRACRRLGQRAERARHETRPAVEARGRGCRERRGRCAAGSRARIVHRSRWVRMSKVWLGVSVGRRAGRARPSGRGHHAARAGGQPTIRPRISAAACAPRLGEAVGDDRAAGADRGTLWDVAESAADGRRQLDEIAQVAYRRSGVWPAGARCAGSQCPPSLAVGPSQRKADSRRCTTDRKQW